mmetsp:Transcript_21993/g.71091  ORF Transcript_21993/g.71091 Transcript_21993/m.71091 type:complete len:332 (+) Transcript_21993:256-1251(+)
MEPRLMEPRKEPRPPVCGALVAIIIAPMRPPAFSQLALALVMDLRCTFRRFEISPVSCVWNSVLSAISCMRAAFCSSDSTSTWRSECLHVVIISRTSSMLRNLAFCMTGVAGGAFHRLHVGLELLDVEHELLVLGVVLLRHVVHVGAVQNVFHLHQLVCAVDEVVDERDDVFVALARVVMLRIRQRITDELLILLDAVKRVHHELPVLRAHVLVQELRLEFHELHFREPERVTHNVVHEVDLLAVLRLRQHEPFGHVLDVHDVLRFREGFEARGRVLKGAERQRVEHGPRGPLERVRALLVVLGEVPERVGHGDEAARSAPLRHCVLLRHL